jgi:hypothetical protein
VSSQGSITPAAAAAVYELADTLTQFWYYAERRWCDAEPGDPPPDRVDALVGRALQLTEDLARHAEVAAPAEALGRGVSAAWDQYRAAWQGRQHVETLEHLQEVDSDFRFEAERRALGRSPLAGPAWAGLKGAAAALQEALPPALRTCFQVSSLLAEELYPTDERNQRVEQLDVTERRFLTVTLNRELGRLMVTLAREFPPLRGLDCELSGETEMRAMEKISHLHQAITRRLKEPPARNTETPEASTTPPAGPGVTNPDSTAREGEAGRGPGVVDAGAAKSENTAQQDSSGKSNRTAGMLSFIPGGFVYRGQRHDLSGKPLQVLEALYQAPGQAMTLLRLRDKIWCDEEVGQEAIRSAVKVARDALRVAMRRAKSSETNDPIPNIDRGTGRTAWRLDLP